MEPTSVTDATSAPQVSAKSYDFILLYLILKLSSLVGYAADIKKGLFKDKSILFDLSSSHSFIVIYFFCTQQNLSQKTF